MGIGKLNRPMGPQYGGQSNTVDGQKGFKPSKTKDMPIGKFMESDMKEQPVRKGMSQKSL